MVKEILPAAARALGLTLQPWEVRAAEDFERVFAALNKERPDGLYCAGGGLMNANQKRIAACVKEPVTVDVRQQRRCGCRWAHVLRGGPQDLYRRAASYVDKILKGPSLPICR